MKFIHLSDLHLGKRVNGFNMLEDQAAVLREIVGIVDSEKPDAVLIAGDVYDKSFPSTEAVQLFDTFLCALAELHTQVLVISGNHDSPERLAFGGRLMDLRGVHMAPVYDGHVPPVVLEDEWGPVYFYMLPFLKPMVVRRFFPEETIESYTDAVRVAIEEMAVDASQRNVLVAHQFVSGAFRSDSEDISVGGLDDVNAAVFGGFDYVALGHLHRPQDVRVGAGTSVPEGETAGGTTDVAGATGVPDAFAVRGAASAAMSGGAPAAGAAKMPAAMTAGGKNPDEPEAPAEAGFCEPEMPAEMTAGGKNPGEPETPAEAGFCERGNGCRIRYCGTPLKYSLSEEHHVKSVTVVELREKGSLSARTVPLHPLRDLRALRGTYMELTNRENYAEADRQDYVYITLTDEEDIPDVAGKLRVIYPNLMRIAYDNRRTRAQGIGGGPERAVETRSPLQLFDEFYKMQNGDFLKPEERAFAQKLIESIWEE